MEMVLEKLVKDPLRIGFVSFTRAARREASTRAAAKFGVAPDDLEKKGFFRTLHSICYHLLGVQTTDLLVGSKDDNAWLKDVLSDDSVRIGSTKENDDAFSMPSDAGNSCRALALWDIARNRLEPLHVVWSEVNELDSRLPYLEFCERVTSTYETAKKDSGRLDFCDLLMRYAGKKYVNQAFVDAPPEGRDPMLQVFFADECQDFSLLSSLVYQRLTRFSTWSYLFLDQWQSIYKFAGADGNIFGSCPVAKEEILPTSYRCKSKILEFSDQIMLRGGHQPRPFRSKDEGGEVLYQDLHVALAAVKPGEDTLVLARTNEYAKKASHILDDASIPWRHTKSAGHGGDSGACSAPARAAGACALAALRRGDRIDGEAIHRLLELLPSKVGGTVLFERGAKKYYEDNRATAHKFFPVSLGDMDQAGGTDAFKGLVASGKYLELLEPPAARMARACELHGDAAVLRPSVRVGTIHSAKGLESRNVVLVNKVPYPTLQAMEDEDGSKEERRVWFTACSRASEKLTIAEDGGNVFPDL